MTVLLDTHTFLWLVADTTRLSPAATVVLADKSNHALLSIASAWEIAIKVSLRKLTVALPLNELLTKAIQRASIELVAIEPPHVVAVGSLPFHHRDPFDRLLAAHCLTESLPIVSADPTFDAYGVHRIW
jgi:PIN domain nuclease of toxin-antitoxin system